MDETIDFWEFHIGAVDFFFLVQSHKKSVALSHPQDCIQLARKFKLQETESGQVRQNMVLFCKHV
jgi:hypothetical protein